MSQADQRGKDVRISVSNIGGIDDTEAAFRPGVTVLEGRNATNRTSLLWAIKTGLGSDEISLKSDADNGSVELTIDDETYTRTLTRNGNTVVTGGDPYLDDPELATLFAFLLESNEARRAVVRNNDLHELIMRPVDTAEIQAKIESLTEKTRRLDDRLEEIDAIERELPDLKQRRNELETEIEKQANQLAEKEAEIESLNADVEETREEKSRLDAKFEDLRDRRSELDEVRSELERKRQSLDSLTERRSGLESELAEMPEAPMGEITDIDSRIDHLRGELQATNSTINEIQTIIQFNEEKLDASNDEIAETLGVTDESSEAVTDQILASNEIVCWTCGSEVEQSHVEETLDQLRGLNEEKLTRKRELDEEIDELEDEKIVYQEKQRQRDQMDSELETIDEKIEQREQRIETLLERSDELEDTVADLESTVEDLESDKYSEILDLHKEANQLEFELGQLEEERDGVQQDIDQLEDEVEERDQLEDQQNEVEEELEELRTRIERIEEQAINHFNDHMDTVLSIMEFENIERIWIERTQERVREGRRKVTQTVFDLHIVRSTDEGTMYEDAVENLSESERETTGLIFALAGYLVHDVYEEVPFMLLDSLEAIDADRIATLVEYFSDYAEYVVVALLPEDAAAVDADHQRLADI